MFGGNIRARCDPSSSSKCNPARIAGGPTCTSFMAVRLFEKLVSTEEYLRRPAAYILGQRASGHCPKIPYAQGGCRSGRRSRIARSIGELRMAGYRAASRASDCAAVHTAEPAFTE